MRLNGFLRHVQAFGYFLVAQPIAHQAQHLLLTRRQRQQQRRFILRRGRRAVRNEAMRRQGPLIHGIQRSDQFLATGRLVHEGLRAGFPRAALVFRVL
ncbi:hypothetical protein D3C87_1891490 [compost metagenome]